MSTLRRKMVVPVVFLGMILVVGSRALAAKDKPISADKQDKQSTLLTRHPEMDTNGDGQLSQDEIQAFKKNRADQWKKRLLKEHPEIDTNKDGQLSDEELKAARDKIASPALENIHRWILEHYPQADTDKDRKLSPKEMQAFVRAQANDWTKEVVKKYPDTDKDKDGLLNQQELKDAKDEVSEWVFKNHPEADTDGNNQIDRKEFRAFARARAGDWTKELVKQYPDLDINNDGILSLEELRAVQGPVGQPDWGKMAEQILKENPKADTDGDGKLSKEEFKKFIDNNPDYLRKHLLERFPDADTDGDGKLSDEELKAFKETRGGKSEGRFRGSRGPQAKNREGHRSHRQTHGRNTDTQD